METPLRGRSGGHTGAAPTISRVAPCPKVAGEEFADGQKQEKVAGEEAPPTDKNKKWLPAKSLPINKRAEWLAANGLPTDKTQKGCVAKEFDGGW